MNTRIFDKLVLILAKFLFILVIYVAHPVFLTVRYISTSYVQCVKFWFLGQPNVPNELIVVLDTIEFFITAAEIRGEVLFIVIFIFRIRVESLIWFELRSFSISCLTDCCVCPDS